MKTSRKPPARERPARRSGTLGGPALALAGLLALAPVASAQQWGQWWWTGLLEARQEGRETLRGGSSISEYDSTQYRLSLDVNGYVVHPLIGDFTVGLDISFSDQDRGGRERDTERYSLQANLDLFPQGAYNSRLFFRRSQFEYETPDPSLLRGLSLADTATSYGGSLLVRKRGLLRGTVVGFSHTDYEFLSPEQKDEFEDRQFLHWTRTGSRLQHRLQLERTLEDLGFVDLEVEERILSFEQRGDLSETWRWDLTTYGIRRDLRTARTGDRSSDSALLRSQLTRHLDRGTLDMRYGFSYSETEAQSSTEGHDLFTSYRRRLRSAWEIGPFVGVSRLSGRGTEVVTPRAGLRVLWARRGPAFAAQVNAQASYLSVDRTSATDNGRNTRTAFELITTLAHGKPSVLRKQLEVQVARNEFKIENETIPELSELTLPLLAAGNQNLYRGRLGVSRQRRGRPINAWAEWRRIESASDLAIQQFETETVRASVQFHVGPIRLQTQAGATELFRQRTGPEEFRYLGASAFWRPIESLQLRASYRADRREPFLTAAIDGTRAEAGFSWRIGLLRLSGRAWEQTRELALTPRTEYRGFTVSVGRAMGGWLPIRNGVKRRGFIR